MAEELRKPSIIFYKDLEPAWHVPGAKEIGTMRWLISWIGGSKGFINSNPGVAVENDDMGVGLMYLPVGQRQKGLHYHSITEIYVILKGHIEGFDATGHSHRAGPMDLINIPKGVPHGVRNTGSGDVELIWLHDGVEARGVTVYCHTQEDIDNAPGKDKIQILHLNDLEPSWTAYKAKEPEFLRWSVNWIGGSEGFENFNPGIALESDKITVGLTVILPAQKSVPHDHAVAEAYVVLKGKGLVDIGQGNREIAYLDGVYWPARTSHFVRNHGSEALWLLWAYGKATKIGETNYGIRS